ncbi:MAG: BMP family ABC transporter substrate-binding protein [Caldilineaceae bacterium]
MKRKSLFLAVNLLVVLTMLLAACGAPASAPAANTSSGSTSASTTVTNTTATTSTTASNASSGGSFQIPDVQDGKFNVAMVLIGPHDDGGWSQAHYEGLQYIEKNVQGVHTAYVELVPEGAQAEQVYRSLARKGFNLIFGTSFGYMDAMATVAEEFPDTMFIHISGYKTNNKNFGNLFGAMEVMKYITGMVSGSRAKTDKNPRIGYMATFPIPEELRLGNAFALGMRKTCPDCTMDVRWLNTWHDPVVEKEAAASLFDAGVQVVFTGADTPAAGDVAQEKGKWGVNYDWSGNCTKERCLATMYWNWGPVYAHVAQDTKDGKYKPGSEYFDADSGSLGVYGLMQGQQPTKGMTDLPADDLKLIKDTMAAALAGKFTRFDVFKGPIKDNKGNEVLPAGKSLEQVDLDGFKEFGAPCKTCMYWWAEGITAELPKLK